MPIFFDSYMYGSTLLQFYNSTTSTIFKKKKVLWSHEVVYGAPIKK